MAKQVNGDDAIGLVEDAIHLLRKARLGAVAWYWAGGIPLALGAALFWERAAHPRAAGPALAFWALGLALLLAWMNCCRAVFASRLRMLLSGTAPVWSARRIFNLAASQSLLGATRLVALPLASVVMFPLPRATSFYRNAAALAAHELEPMELIARARRLARYRPGENWTLLALIGFFYAAVFVNVVLALALLPQMARVLTGYETAFSRSGLYFAANPAFWMCALSLVWLAMDPFIQAIHCVRCFRAESVETGEDLRVGLRRLRGAATAAVALMLLVLPARAAERTAVSPEELARAAGQAMQAPQYAWRIPPDATDAGRPPWIVAVTDRIVESARSVVRAIGRLVGRILRWLFPKPDGIPAPGGAMPVASLPASVALLTALALALCGYLLLRSRAARARPAPVPGGIPTVPRLDAEDIDPMLLPEQSWIEMAERCLKEEDWRLAMRALYLASLSWLGRREFLAIHPAKTNREYQLELRRRTRSAPEARDAFAANLAAFERSWYGMHETGAEDVAGFRRFMETMKAALEKAA